MPANSFENIPEDVNELSDLPLNELLSQKKYLSNNESSDSEIMPGPLALMSGNPDRGINPLEHMQVKGLHRIPIKRGHYEEEDDEEWVPKGKDKGKINKIFNTSIMALSFLAFGGYLLCLIVNAIKEKNKEMMATAVTPTAQQQLLLQQLLSQSNQPYPLKLPTGSFAIHPGKRKKRSDKQAFVQSSNITRADYDDRTIGKLLDGLKMFSEDVVAIYNLKEIFK